MDISTFKTRAKENLIGKWGILIAALVIVAVANGIASSVSGSIGKIIPFIGFFITSLGSVLIMPILIGYNRIHMDVAEHKEPELETLLVGFKDGKFVNNFVTLLIMEVLLVLWTLLFIIPGIIKGLAYSMTSFILADPDFEGIEPMDAITKSKDMMEGHKMDLFILVLSFLGWFILCLLTFGVLILYVGPYVQQTVTQFYYAVKGQAPVINQEEVISTEQEVYYE